MLYPSLVVALLVAGTTPRLDPDVCQLLTVAEITSALGATPAAGMPTGPTREGSATSWGCDRRVGAMFLSVNLVQHPSPAAAASDMAEMMRIAATIDDGIPLATVPGPGEKAVWGSSSEGALWVVLKGKDLLNVTLAGDIANPAAMREPLKKLVTLALGRL